MMTMIGSVFIYFNSASCFLPDRVLSRNAYSHENLGSLALSAATAVLSDVKSMDMADIAFTRP